MRRIKWVVVAWVSVLAVALSAVPVGAAASPVPPAGTSTDFTVKKLAPGDWNCTNGYSCYYDYLNGQGKLFTAARCGTHNLMGGPYQDKISSIANYGSGTVEVWKWIEDINDFVKKGWVEVGQEGNFHNPAVSIDMIYIWCT